MDEFTITVSTEQGVVIDQITVSHEDVDTYPACAFLGDRIAQMVLLGERMLAAERKEA